MPRPEQDSPSTPGLQDPAAESRGLDEVLQTGRRFRELVDNLDAVLWISDPHAMRCDYVSPAYEEIFGRSCQSLLGNLSTFLEAIHPEDVGRVREAMKQELQNRRTHVEYRILRPDGRVRWVQDRGFPICDENGQVRRVAGVATDITARKEAEARAQLLAEASRVLGATLAVPDIYVKLAELVVPALSDLCIVDLLEDGKINRTTTRARPGLEHLAERVKGFAPELHEHQHPLLRAMNERRLIWERVSDETKADLGATAARVEVLAELKPLALVVVPLTARGRVLGALQFILRDPARPDFTPEDVATIEELARRTSAFVDNAYLYQDAEAARERAEAIANSLAEHVERLSAVEAQLKSAVRLRDDFLSVASHELKTPLTGLRLQVDVLRRHGPGRDPSDDWLRTSLARIHGQLGRFERLVDELLDVSRIQAGHLELRPEPLDLGELAIEVVGVFRQHPAYTDRIHIQSEVGVVGHWDRARLDQILSNLLSNALKYGRDLPVEVSIRADRGLAVVVVKDRGIGIPPTEQKRVFERFERAAPPQHYGGLGLGLWIVREIIEAMGGSIEVESRVDEGSTFTVRLPLTGLEAGGRAADESRRIRPA
jgi:PAS domain S-box-containing protein